MQEGYCYVATTHDGSFIVMNESRSNDSHLMVVRVALGTDLLVALRSVGVTSYLST